jgi:hypothetical protein
MNKRSFESWVILKRSIVYIVIEFIRLRRLEAIERLVHLVVGIIVFESVGIYFRLNFIGIDIEFAWSVIGIVII